MHVVVVQSQSQGGSPTAHQTYEGVDAVGIADGHLVLKTGMDIVAAYAPGQWLRFYRDDVVVAKTK